MSSDDRELHLLMSTSRTQRSESLLRPQTHKMVFWRQSEPTPATTKTRRMRLLWSYAPDWFYLFICFVFYCWTNKLVSQDHHYYTCVRTVYLRCNVFSKE